MLRCLMLAIGTSFTQSARQLDRRVERMELIKDCLKSRPEGKQIILVGKQVAHLKKNEHLADSFINTLL